MSRRTPARQLTVYRAWAMLLCALTVYVVLVIPVQYYGHGLHDPGFVLPNVGVLLAWWGVITRTLMSWEQLVAMRRRQPSA